MSLSSYHVYGSFDKAKRKTIVSRVVKELRDVDFDAFAVRGVSGLIMAPIVAYLLDKHVIVVRKPKTEEYSHASQLVEVPITEGKYIVFDDFTGSGATAREIMERVRLACPKMECVGGYVWCPDRRFSDNLKIPVLNVPRVKR